MATFITVYHGGVVITNEIGSYEFVGVTEPPRKIISGILGKARMRKHNT
jgi:hypothetical protein